VWWQCFVDGVLGLVLGSRAGAHLFKHSSAEPFDGVCVRINLEDAVIHVTGDRIKTWPHLMKAVYRPSCVPRKYCHILLGIKWIGVD